MASLVFGAPAPTCSAVAHLHARRVSLPLTDDRPLSTTRAAAAFLLRKESVDLSALKTVASPKLRKKQVQITVFDRRLRSAFQKSRGTRGSVDVKIPRTRSGEGSSGNVSVSEKLADDDIVELPASVDYISSPGNAYVKHLVKLRTSAKVRNSARSVMVTGTVTLREICCCDSGPSQEDPAGRLPPIDVLLVRQDAQVPPDLAVLSRRIVRVGSSAMSKLSGLDSPSEAVGVLKFPSKFCAFESLEGSAVSAPNMVTLMERNWCHSPRRILVLDRIQDPGNLGTLLRTVAAFAWDAVFLLQGCCDPFNDKALRAARGASFRVPVATGEWTHVREFASAKNLKLYAGDPEPDACGTPGHSCFVGPHENGLLGSIPVLRGDEGLCLILGSEGQGLSEEVKRDCTPIGISMPGDFESLNVAVAGGILMFVLGRSEQ